MRSEIRRIQRELNITMIYVTHDQVEAMTMGDRIMILHEGKIQQVGKPIDIYNNPANPFVATFIGAPAMNLANAKIDRKTSELVIDETIRVAIPESNYSTFGNQPLTAGIRPEHLRMPKKDTEDVDKVYVEVTNVEILGDETIFSFVMKKTEWSVKWSGQWHIEIGDIVPVEFDFASLCIFDAETEQLIKKPSNVGSHVLHKEVPL